MTITRLASILLACTLALPAYAQPKNALTRFFKKAAPQAGSSSRVQAAEVSFARAAQEADALLAHATLRARTWRSPVLDPLEKNIHHFIFTVSQVGQEQGFHGSGFVIAENLSGKTVLWGVTAKHVLNAFHGDLQITFSAGGKRTTFPVKNVISGRKYGLNAALLQLPQEAAQVARPIPLELAAPLPQETVFAFGFNRGKYQKLTRQVIYSHAERLIARFPFFNQPKPGFCGCPVVNEKGRLVGIETGGYVPAQENNSWYYKLKKNPHLKNTDISRVSEIVPTNRLILLLKEYYHPGAGNRSMYLNGIKVGELDVHEFIEFIRVWYRDGRVATLERNPFLEPGMLEQWLDLQGATQVSIQVNKNRSQHSFYIVDLLNKTVTKQ